MYVSFPTFESIGMEKKNKQTNDCILFENNIKIVSFFSLSGFTPQILFPFVTF